MRRLVEKIMANKVRRRNLSEQFSNAPIYVSAGAALGYFFKPMEKLDPTLLETAKALVRPGNIVWDIGGNIGLFSVAAANLSGKSGQIYTFEPDVELIKLLRRTSNIQPDISAPIKIIPAAVAESTGLRDFDIAARGRAANALSGYGSSQMGGKRETQTIIALSLDKALSLLPSPAVVKIDVEGAELEILQAEGELIKSVRPVIAVEVTHSNIAEMTDRLTTANYILFDADQGLNRKSLSEMACWNTLAIPAEKLDDYLK